LIFYRLIGDRVEEDFQDKEVEDFQDKEVVVGFDLKYYFFYFCEVEELVEE